jgi:hypothetical protein
VQRVTARVRGNGRELLSEIIWLGLGKWERASK